MPHHHRWEHRAPRFNERQAGLLGYFGTLASGNAVSPEVIEAMPTPEGVDAEEYQALLIAASERVAGYKAEQSFRDIKSQTPSDFATEQAAPLIGLWDGWEPPRSTATDPHELYALMKGRR